MLGLFAQRGKRIVCAHGSDGFFAFVEHRIEDPFQFFFGVAVVVQAVFVLALAGGLGVHRRQVVQRHFAFLEPGPIRLLHANGLLELFVADDAARFEVDHEHLARLQASLFEDVFGLHGQGASLRRKDDAAVFGQGVA